MFMEAMNGADPPDPCDGRLREIISSVGADAFERACEFAWATAAGTGKALGAWTGARQGTEDAEADKAAQELPHDLVDLTIDDERRPWVERIPLHFALYRRMPRYALLMYCAPRDMPDEARAMFWAELRALLEEDDPRLADPAAYWLWCGPFEVREEVDEAWTEVAVKGDPGRRRLERVLGASGPVPWSIKVGLLEALAPDPTWHETILAALTAAEHDVYGDIDAEHATQIVRCLSSG